MNVRARRRRAPGVALATAVCVVAGLVAAGCAALAPWVAPSPTAVELMPGPASIGLTSEPASPFSPVDILMTSPVDAGVRFAHAFEAGRPLRGSFATSQGTYTLSALGGACRLPLVMGSDDAAEVVLTLGPGTGCTLTVARRGRMGDPGMDAPDDAVLITNRDAGAATPRIEPETPPTAP